jgi:predicted nucleotidyltransferase
MMKNHAQEMVARRDALIARLVDMARSDERIAGLWLQGSLAQGGEDPYSDVDAYIAVDDTSFDAVYAERETLLGKLFRPFAWCDATTPGIAAVHALSENGVKLDLFYETESALDRQKRPAVKMLFDRRSVEPKLHTGWEPPLPTIAQILGTIIKMTRQGATWPLRLLHRGQWSSLAMMEIDLINAQIAQLMALQADAENFYKSPFSLYRLLTAEQQAEIDRLTHRALFAVAHRDATELKEVHLEVYDALVREGRGACAAIGAPYPLKDADERDLRTLLEREWAG